MLFRNLFYKLKKYVKKIPYMVKAYKYICYKIKIYKIKKATKNHKRLLKKYSKRDNTPLTVLFVLTHLPTFKTKKVFEKMLKDPNFRPVILIAPYTQESKEKMLSDMEEMYKYFNKMNYPVINAYDSKNDSWVDVKKEINPDVIFMSNPHNLTMSKYYEELFLNYICLYVPYSHQISKYSNYYAQYNQLFHNAMYKIFAPHKVDLLIHKKYSDNKGKNVEVTGYPATEVFLDKKYIAKDVWKKQSHKKIRIIYAPHHTIDSPELPFSNVLKCADYFKELAQITKDAIQWAFKPHPLLKMKLKKHKDWGEARTNEHWNFWKNQENTQLEEGEYIDLFLTSDALIHDSGSFLVEYLYVNKPVLFLVSRDDIKKYFNPFGCEAFDVCYHGKKKEDINFFIDSLIKKNDSMKEKREQFLKKHIYPFHEDKMPSDRIIESIRKTFRIS